ncbi:MULTISPECIES: DUF190 domain-containing protein [Streptomycetaceae]|uniref:Putative regulatory protein n=2 Tax=Streptantibioticus cattleyicolor TaxID=29303 RepID=F8K543_STREN|nr:MULTISPECIES: DUF190 domain-containing protein [Streptomycetaceae]AEW96519.1 putative regulatory protein [Streptantibioticus cattleyicolor NRRL 8057 = DSM 46488]MYS61021.1 DUF190 domain-containing protein [Streptomyces sp. SID5468]CAJ20011.1 putative regulatory protein [Streptantibioticus cattleyicolor]CCB76856.1 conserved protein of unknown function [Streptantibioticus cattleyicolor NRRL 8057 = DSM 46488]
MEAPRPRPAGALRRLTVFTDLADRCAGRPRYAEIVRLGRQRGLRGMSVLRGIGGYGRSGVVREGGLLRPPRDLPVMVVAVDTAEAIESFLPVLERIAPENLIVLDEVRAVRFPAPGRGPGPDPLSRPGSSA